MRDRWDRLLSVWAALVMIGALAGMVLVALASGGYWALSSMAGCAITAWAVYRFLLD